MLPLFEMMLKAQNGAATEAMARQFGLAQEQVSQAMAALTPAFSSGFKRTATNPYDLGPLMGTMLSGVYGKYFEDVGRAFSEEGKADGNIVLERLFGSKETSRAIAAQAEQLTGIGQDILKRMMPAMADTIMGGLFKQATGQLGVTPAFPLSEITRQWLKAMGMDDRAARPDIAANPFQAGYDNPLAKSLRTFWGMEKAEPPPPHPFTDNPFAGNPFAGSAFAGNNLARAFEDMMGGRTAARPASSWPDSASTRTTSDADGRSPLVEAVSQMFDSGLEVQKSYQKSMDAIFDHYLGPLPGRKKPDQQA